MDWKDFGISTAGDALGTGLGILTNNMLQRQNFKWSEKAAESSYQRQMALYNRMYQDKSPLNVRKQLEAAGLNPALMYSGGAGGVGGAASGTTAGNVQQFQTQGLMNKANLALTASQIELNKAEADKTRSQIPLAETQIGEMSEHINLMKKQGEELAATISNKQASTELINAQTSYQETANKIQSATAETVVKTAVQELNNLEAQHEEILSNKNLNDSERNKIETLLDQQLLDLSAGVALKKADIRLTNMQWTYLAGELKNLLPDLKNRTASAEAAKTQAETAAGNLKFSKERWPYEFGENVFRDILITAGMIFSMRKGGGGTGFTEEIIERTEKTGMYGDGTKKTTKRTHTPSK